MKYLLTSSFVLLSIFGSQAVPLTFRVDMQRQAVPAGGVHVAGNFQFAAGVGSDWDPAAIAMTDADGDQVYELTIDVPAGDYLYKFINGTTWPVSEIVPLACGIDDGGGNVNRSVTVGGTGSTVETLCFGQCVSCDNIVIPPPPSPPVYITSWWNEAVFYEVFVRSFYDNNGDGKGDFAGLTAKLDYLNDGNPNTTTDLGITAIWLMPMMPSPSYHGYDVTDYKGVESDYGTMAQFDAFLAAAHARGIKVIIDFVMNHSSSQHPWFTQSAGSATSPYRDWYRWSTTDPGYQGPWGQDVWHRRGSNYYYGLFYDGMPDLNWDSRPMRTAIYDAAKFWLRKGVDGFRLDAVKYLVEEGQALQDAPGTFAALQEFHDTVRAARPDAFTVGEAWSSSSSVVLYVQDNRLDACFEFDLAGAILNSVNSGSAAEVLDKLNEVTSIYPQLAYGTFLTNHDQDRAFNVLSQNESLMKQAAALYLTMPGVPFLYYGEEIGMVGTGADENKRVPMQWSNTARAGFTTGNPWRAPNDNYDEFNVAAESADPASILNQYKKLIAIRMGSDALKKGYYLPVTASTDPIAAYGRVFEDEAVLVVSNLNSSAAATPALSVSLSSLAAGTYYVTDLYTGRAGGTLTVDANGSFTNWTATLGQLGANQTWILSISQTPASVAKAKAQLALKVYPNPASDHINVELTGAGTTSDITVYSLQGKPLEQHSFTGASYSLETSGWPKGTYFVKVRSGKHVAVEHLVVLH